MPEPRIVDYLIRIRPHEDNPRNAETIRQTAADAMGGGGGAAQGAGGGGPSTPYQGGGSPRAGVYQGSQPSERPAYTTQYPSPPAIAATGAPGASMGGGAASTASGVRSNPRAAVVEGSSTVTGFDVSRSPPALQQAYQLNERAFATGSLSRQQYESNLGAIQQTDPNYRAAQAAAARARVQQERQDRREREANIREQAKGIREQGLEEKRQETQSDRETRIEREANIRENVAAGKKSDRYSRKDESRDARFTREYGEVQDLEYSGQISDVQAERAKQGLKEDYTKKAWTERESLLRKYNIAQIAVQTEEANIQRSLSYTAMAATQSAAGFAMLARFSGADVTKLLQSIMAIEGAMFAVRGVFLGAASMGRIGYDIKRANWRMGEGEKIRQQLTGQGKSAAEIEEALTAGAASAVPMQAGLGLTTRAVSAVVAHPGLALGAVAGTAVLGGAGYLASKGQEWMFPSSSLGKPLPSMSNRVSDFSTMEGYRTAGMWERRRRGFEVREQMAAENAPKYQMAWEKYTRGREISMRRGETAVRESYMGTIPGPESAFRQVAESKAEYAGKQERFANVEAEFSRAQSEYADIRKAEEAAAEANQAREAEIKRLKGASYGARESPGFGASPGFAGTMGGGGLSVMERRRLQQLESTPASPGPTQGEIKEKEDKLKKATEDLTTSRMEASQSLLRLREAEAAFARSMLDAARGYASAASGKAQGATQGFFQSAVRSGGMSIQENVQLDIARRMLRSGVPTSILAANGMLQMLQNAPDKETRMEVEAAQYRAGRKPGLEQEEIRMWNTTTAEALGINERDITPDPRIMERVGINLQSPARSREFLRRGEQLRAFGMEPGILGENPMILAEMRNNPDVQRQMQLQLRKTGQDLATRGIAPEAVGLTRDLVGPNPPGIKPGQPQVNEFPNMAAQIAKSIEADTKYRSASVENEKAMIRILSNISGLLEMLQRFAIGRQEGQNAAEKNAPAGDKPQAGINWAQQRILGMS